MKRIIFSLIAVSMFLASPLMAYTEEESVSWSGSVDLIAGQSTDVGEVEVWNEDGTLYVKYIIEDGWCMTESHLQVADSKEDIPQTRTGNPKPGQFELKSEHDPCVEDYTYDLSWDMEIQPFVAAHAVVQKTIVLEESPYYPSTVKEYSQGLKKDGTFVKEARSDPEQGLVFEEGRDESNFFSLGFGGYIVVEFDCPVRNGDGNDLKVIEDTWGSYPLEKAEVSAGQDGEEWIYLGVADNTNADGIHTISEFDLGELESARYVKIVDTSKPNDHNSEADGYDLNAVQALQDCVEVQEETAWAEGERFTERGSWAMYFPVDGQLLIEQLTVDAKDSDGVSSSVELKNEEDYMFKVWGTYSNKPSDPHEVDAEYISFDSWNTHLEGYPDRDTFLLELAVNGEDVDWGDYRSDHTYYLDYEGQGSSVNFGVYDTYYGDNEGEFMVEIYRVY